MSTAEPAPPGPMYGPGARDLQDHFDSRRLADRLFDITLHDELNDDDIALVGAQAAVWLATVDVDGWPDVSYKGGAPGFVEVVDRSELRIPSYDGNGMFRSLGNVCDTGRLALLFVDTDRPWRMRIHGTGRVSTDPTDVARHAGAQAVLIVTVERVFPNCGRYVHSGSRISEYVPDDEGDAPVPDWKRLPSINDALPADDPARMDAD